MWTHLRAAFLMLLVMTLITGVAYPLAVTGIARVAFAAPSAGGLIMDNGHVRGSNLIGQNFDDPRYLWGRLSATSPAYNAASSTGSNLGPTNAALATAAKARIKALQDADPGNSSPIPVDLVTASASGLDPHITPAAAIYQVPRVARARKLDAGRVRAVVDAHTEGRLLGFLGEPRVNVLEVNLALDHLE